MRIYLCNDNKNFFFEFDGFEKNNLSANMQFSALFSLGNEKKMVFFKKAALHYFYSLDQISWHLVSNFKKSKNIVLINQNYTISYGFLPSSSLEQNHGSLTAKIPGKISKIFVKKGQFVKKGDTILVLEAMKMENEIKTNINGLIDEIFVSEGMNVNSGQNLVTIIDKIN